MKLLILIFSFLFSAVDEGYVQCGKNIRLTSSKTIHMDGNGIITRTEVEKSVVEINQLLITINVRDEFKTVCNIKSIECNWDIPFKKGKTLIEAKMGRLQRFVPILKILKKRERSAMPISPLNTI